MFFASRVRKIESYKNAIEGKYAFVKLTERFGKAVLPEVRTVDISDSKSIISNELYSEIEAVLEDKKQAILLMNRRGFNTFATCESCKKNIENLIDFYNNYSKKYDAKIISINVGEKTDKPMYPWTNWEIEPQILKQKYDIDIIRTPEIYILDNEKKVLNKTVIYSHIKSTIEDWESL